MSPIQLLAIFGSLLMGYATYVAFRRRELRRVEFAVWMAIWLVLVVVSIFPDRLRAIVHPLMVARLLDLVLIVGMFVLTVIVFRLNRALRRLDNRIERLVRELALSSTGAPGCQGPASSGTSD
jgi:hypothetical protein